MGKGLAEFVAESNRIEGIADVRQQEVDAHGNLLAQPSLAVTDLVEFVAVVVRDPRLAKIRNRAGMDVRVGQHVPTGGGPHVPEALDGLLKAANNRSISPYDAHHRYETLHPFMDGNGRSGRALWLWMMHHTHQVDRALALGFLHAWYYQSLQANRPPSPVKGPSENP